MPYESKKQICDTRDNQVYKTVKICNADETSCQTWMAENLNYSVNPGEQSLCYDDDAENCDKYGRLYTWAAAVGKLEDECGVGHFCDLNDVKNENGEVQGVCPEGWHLPDITEWKTLIDNLGGESEAGTKLKTASGWVDNTGVDGNGTDDYGFSALPAGNRINEFDFVGYSTFFWSASYDEDDDEEASYLFLTADGPAAEYENNYKDYTNSVRCIKD